MQPFRIFWRSVRAWYDELTLMAALSTLWWLCTATIVLGPPATAALYVVANRAATGRRVYFDLFKESFRAYFKRGWILSTLNLGLLVLFLSSFFFYLALPAGFPEWMRALALIMFYLIMLWAVVQLYLFPLLVEQDMPVRKVFRNALVLSFGSPVYTGISLLLLGVVVALSALTTVLLVLAVPAFVAIMSSFAFQDRLIAIGVKSPPPPDSR